MMTQGIPWPLAYGGFLVGAGMIGVMTFMLLKYLDGRPMRPKKV